jgi:hypothetical protein
MALPFFGRRSVSLAAAASCLYFVVCNIVHLESYAVCLSSPTSIVRAHAKSFSSCYSKQSAVSLPYFQPLWLLPSKATSPASVSHSRTIRCRVLGLDTRSVTRMAKNCLQRQAAAFPVAVVARPARPSFAMRLSESGRDASDAGNATESAAAQPPPWEAALGAMCEGGPLAPTDDAEEGAEMVVIGKIIIDEFVLRWRGSKICRH